LNDQVSAAAALQPTSLSRRSPVAVVIPCWNAAAWVGEAMRSALDQKDVSPEVMVVDDGSTDGSLEVIRSFGDRVRWVSGPNGGVSAARNRGLAETSSNWVVFLDADDLLAPGTLAARLTAAGSVEADVVVCDWREFSTEPRTPDGAAKAADMIALEGDAELACAIGFKPATAAVMYRRSLLERVGGFREDLPLIEDARLLFDAAHVGARFVRSAHEGAHIRQLPRSLSKRDPAAFWRCALRNGTQVEAIWREAGALDQRRRTAIEEIYNGAAHGLFRAGDGEFFEAIGRLRAARLRLTTRNRTALALVTVLGIGPAADLANRWTRLRRRATAGASAHA
jgi:GT2 family glycosyltransferase